MAGRRRHGNDAQADGLSPENLARELRRSQMERRRNRRARWILLLLLTALTAGTLASSRLFAVVTVKGSSMSPTLGNGSVVLCARFGIDDISRGDLVMFRYDGALLIKRVIGIGGDTVSVDESGQLRVNGIPAEEEYLTVKGAAGGDLVYPVSVPAKQLFVLGDHRGIVADSRSRAFGMVPEISVTGRPLLVLWPLFRIGALSS